MSNNQTLVNQINHIIGQKTFLMCDQCLWTVTSVNKKYLEEIINANYNCPACHQEQLSSFPIISSD
jgi:Zn finger protein HypA/HybF involved in hydrogenase expression